MRTYGVLMKVKKMFTEAATNKLLWRTTQAVAMWCLILNALANHGWGLIGL